MSKAKPHPPIPINKSPATRPVPMIKHTHTHKHTHAYTHPPTHTQTTVTHLSNNVPVLLLSEAKTFYHFLLAAPSTMLLSPFLITPNVWLSPRRRFIHKLLFSLSNFTFMSSILMRHYEVQASSSYRLATSLSDDEIDDEVKDRGLSLTFKIKVITTG